MPRIIPDVFAPDPPRLDRPPGMVAIKRRLIAATKRDFHRQVLVKEFGSGRELAVNFEGRLLARGELPKRGEHVLGRVALSVTITPVTVEPISPGNPRGVVFPDLAPELARA